MSPLSLGQELSLFLFLGRSVRRDSTKSGDRYLGVSVYEFPDISED